MRRETIEVIDHIVEYFSQEELETLALKSRSNKSKITFREQLISRYFEHKIRYPLEICKIKAYIILDNNQSLVNRLIVSNTEEFKQKMKEELNNVDSYITVNRTGIEGEGEAKLMNIGNSSAVSMNRSSSKNRAGSADSGYEYTEIDKLWDAEDMKFLNKGSSMNRDFPHIKKLENSDSSDLSKISSALDNYEIDLAIRPEKQSLIEYDNTVKDDVSEMQKKLDDEGGTPKYYTVSVAQSRDKNLSDSQSSGFGFMQNKRKHKTGVQKTWTSRLQAYQKFNSLQIRPVREVLLKKLDVLFTYCGCLY